MKQMTQIERRQVRITRIHTQNLGEDEKLATHEQVAVNLFASPSLKVDMDCGYERSINLWISH
jgi:hypothetical protein